MKLTGALALPREGERREARDIGRCRRPQLMRRPLGASDSRRRPARGLNSRVDDREACDCVRRGELA